MEIPSPRFRRRFTVAHAIAFVGVMLTAAPAIWHSISSRAESELSRKQNSVSIAVGILSSRAPKDKDGNIKEFEPDQQRLRRWAIEVLNDNADIKIPEDSAEVIATGRAGIGAGYGSYYTDYTYDSYDGYYDVSDDRSTPGAGSPSRNKPRRER